MRGNDCVWNIYFGVNPETQEHLRYGRTKEEAQVLHGGVSLDGTDEDGFWIFGCDYSHRGDEAHERGEYDYEFYLKESQEAEEYFTAAINLEVELDEILCMEIDE